MDGRGGGAQQGGQGMLQMVGGQNQIISHRVVSIGIGDPVASRGTGTQNQSGTQNQIAVGNDGNAGLRQNGGSGGNQVTSGSIAAQKQLEGGANQNQGGARMGRKILQCQKCKELGHVVKYCTVVIQCIICAKETHLTEDCVWPKQVKSVASFVGYGAPGLGCILVHNSKITHLADHVNPMAIIQTKGGGVSEQQIVAGFQAMFKWNWEWRAKANGNNQFLMRMPSKAKLEELCNFEDFGLKGTGVFVKVLEWILEVTANGKLNTAWV